MVEHEVTGHTAAHSPAAHSSATHSPAAAHSPAAHGSLDERVGGEQVDPIPHGERREVDPQIAALSGSQHQGRHRDCLGEEMAVGGDDQQVLAGG